LICQYAQLFVGLYNFDIKSGKFFFYHDKKLPGTTKTATMFKFENIEIDNFQPSYIDTEDNNNLITFLKKKRTKLY
jgi:hypothetical protein